MDAVALPYGPRARRHERAQQHRTLAPLERSRSRLKTRSEERLAIREVLEDLTFGRIVGRRGGKAVNIAAPPGRRVSLGRGGTVEVGDLFFRRPNVSLRAGGTVTWRFRGPTLHNITLANGARGFSSPNLSDGRQFKKKLSVPGTYQLFCGLHPVNVTATIKVKGRTK